MTKTDFYFPDKIFRLRAPVVPNLEMQVDILDENEPDAEVLDPFRVQIVIDNLRLPIITPCSMLQIGLFNSQ